jgi:glucosamine-6-phosphate deaminase
VLLLVSGGNKAQALRAVIEGSVSQMWTASCLQMHPNAIIVCDEPATYELKVGTVRYFKDIERL